MARDGMAGDFFRRSGFVNLRYMPDPKTEYVESFENLIGGINRFDLDYRLSGSESPFIQNLSWHNGVLCSRWGQVKIGEVPAGVKAVASFLFHGWLLIHANHCFYAYKIRPDGNTVEQPVGTIKRLGETEGTLEDVGGVFFRYREEIFYKTRGLYLSWGWDETTDTVSGDLGSVSSSLGSGRVSYWIGNYVRAYTPIVQINTDPTTGAGDLYQPENRLSPYKWVHFNVPSTPVATYQIPYKKFDGPFFDVFVDDVELPSTAYLVDTVNGTVTFADEYIPQPHDPPVNNTVRIRFGVANYDAYDSLLDCPAAAVFGGAQDLCVVLGGCDAQPNAYFWSGHNGNVLDPSYFPMNQYNLAGDNSDPITAFGKQQNMLVILQSHATGRATFGTTKINEREQVTMDYTRINAEIGCDLPGSLQLVENNLVWCNRRYGVCRLRDSSAAYENNIVVISRKINGDYGRAGLLSELAGVTDEAVHSFDTGRKYFLVFGTNSYEWNYELSEYTNPSWFYHKGILGVGFVPEDNDALYEVTEQGWLARFLPVFSDFNNPIEKIYTLPPRNFGTYDRLKNINSMIFTTRGDANTNTRVTYTCDYSQRVDPTNLVSTTWRLVPRNLEFRDLSVRPYSAVFRRKPGYRNIRHLGVQLYNNEAGKDLSLVSAQIFYTFRGRQR